MSRLGFLLVVVLIVIPSHASEMQPSPKDRRVLETGPDGRPLFTAPVGVRCHTDGRVFVVDDEAHRVRVFDASGQALATFGEHGSGPGQLLWPDAVHWDAADRLYVADAGANRVQVWDAAGAFLYDIGRPPRWRRSLAPLLGFLAIALGLAAALVGLGLAGRVAPNLNERSLILALSIGSAVSALGWTFVAFVLFSGLRNPRDVLVGGDGLVYVSDFGADRVRVFDADGDLLRSIGAGRDPESLRGPLGLALSRDGRLYVADSGNHRVQVYDPAGELVTRLGHHGTGPGELESPHGLALDPDGVLYVADRGNGRIQVWTEVSARPGILEWSANIAGDAFVPAGICLAGDGALFIADLRGHRVVIQPADVVRAARRRP